MSFHKNKIYEDFKSGFLGENPNFLKSIKVSKNLRKFILVIFAFSTLMFLIFRDIYLIEVFFVTIVIICFTIFGMFALLFFSLKDRNYKNIEEKIRLLLTREQIISTLYYIIFVILFFLIKL